MNNIYKFDETGFLIGHGRSENILSKTPKKRHTIASQSSRIAVTAIECTSMTGYILPPLLILPGKRQMSDWYDSNRDHLPNQYMIKTSDNGYTSDEIAYHWIHHFVLKTIRAITVARHSRWSASALNCPSHTTRFENCWQIELGIKICLVLADLI
jgi:hypothetical protein